jgi:hypothetical protein
MNIRKIIKEEIGDFDWMRDVTPFNTGEKYVITIIDKPIEYKKKILDLLHDNRYYCSLEPILGGHGNIIDYELSDGFNLEEICYIVLDNYESLIYDDGYKLSYLPCSNRGYTYEWVESYYGKDHTIISSEQLIKILNNPLNEQDDFDWVRDVTPRVFDLLDIATKDNPRINVYFYKGDFIRILDRNGMNYFDAHDIGDYLGVEPEEVYDISKKDLMRYILGNHILGGSWHGYIDPKNIKDSSNYDTNEDYKDYVDLYELVKSL